MATGDMLRFLRHEDDLYARIIATRKQAQACVTQDEARHLVETEAHTRAADDDPWRQAFREAVARGFSFATPQDCEDYLQKWLRDYCNGNTNPSTPSHIPPSSLATIQFPAPAVSNVSGPLNDTSNTK